MAIERCDTHERAYDRDHHTECPVCAAVIEPETAKLIRDLMDAVPFQAKDKPLYDRCKRVLGEA
jgi:hypothetical protein